MRGPPLIDMRHVSLLSRSGSQLMYGQVLLMFILLVHTCCHIDSIARRIEFFERGIAGIINDVSVAVRNTIWFQHNGALAHFRKDVLNYLNATYALNGLDDLGQELGYDIYQAYQASNFSYGET